MTRAICALALALLACQGRGASGGGGAPSYDYVRCTGVGSTCGVGGICERVLWRDGDGEVCTSGCSGPSACPHDGRCLDVNMSGTFTCFQSCTLDADCATGLICQPVTTGGGACLPM